MKNPIAAVIEKSKTWDDIVSQPLMIGSEYHIISMPFGIWDYLDTLIFYGYDTERLLKDCSKKLINDDLSKTLWLWLWWIGHNEHKENGIKLHLRETD